MTEITFDEFKKAEIKIGTILSAEKVPDADKLIKLMIDLGPKKVAPVVEGGTVSLEQEETIEVEKKEERDIRQILSGIALYYPDPAVLVGKQVPVLANLPTRTIRGFESQGMVLYAVGLKQPEGSSPDRSGGLGTDFLITVQPERAIPAGTPLQ